MLFIYTIAIYTLFLYGYYTDLNYWNSSIIIVIRLENHLEHFHFI